MFGIGFGEILLLLVIALVVYGPDRLPSIARKAGKLAKEWKKITSDIQETIEKEIDDVGHE